jgi:Spy/CpxP family protein refolding chaperone
LVNFGMRLALYYSKFHKKTFFNTQRMPNRHRASTKGASMKMNINPLKKIITVVAAFAILGVGGYAFAGWGYGHHMYDGPGYGGNMMYDGPGYGGHMYDGSGYGGHMMYDGGYGGHMYGGPHHGYGNYGYNGDNFQGRNDQSYLSREQIEKLEKQDEAFYKDTEKLRDSLYQKELALRDELAKEKPDAGKAETLQKELSGLRAKFDQKRIDHLIQMRQIAPDAGRGLRGGYGASWAPCWR